MNGVEARQTMIDEVRHEFMGPSIDLTSRGTAVDCSSGPINLDDFSDSPKPFYEKTTCEEILTGTDPLQRYGIGILFSGAETESAEGSYSVEDDISWITGLPHDTQAPLDDQPKINVKASTSSSDSDDFDLTDANTFKPSSMGISFSCKLPENSELSFTVQGAYYDSIDVYSQKRREDAPPAEKNSVAKRKWWVRRPVEFTGRILGSSIGLQGRSRIPVTLTHQTENAPRVTPRVEVFFRRKEDEGQQGTFVVTAVVSNPSPKKGPENALFQVNMTVEIAGSAEILPYPQKKILSSDNEELSLELLYRKKECFAIGHGCAATWSETTEQSPSWLRTAVFPEYEVPSLTPNIFTIDETGNREPLLVDMFELSQNSEVGKRQVNALIDLYENWISARDQELPDIPSHLSGIAQEHLSGCREVLERIRAGWEIVQTDPIASRAFKLTNLAMLEQQHRSRLALRNIEVKDGTYVPDTEHPQIIPVAGENYWRPFQIAFILATTPEITERTHFNRAKVDLIYFPTGGGKTEAYLGASAMSLLSRRLRDPSDSGTDTLMRYTLRLLTSQQFLRAASLTCALEDIRQAHPSELGAEPISIGVWLGSASTPNTWKAARADLADLARHGSPNRFLLLRCPWCAANMSPIRGRGRRQPWFTPGYRESGKEKVVLSCPDRRCKFTRQLPIHVVDQDIYEIRPSIIIGTVDKFAMLAWRPEAHRLFGLNADGQRTASPPGLIIQDELHLISGPLGSMVGIYEPIVNELCTDYRSTTSPPKIIASTATVRHYGQQIEALYGRRNVTIFPPHGLEDGKSFFAEPETDNNGNLTAGRRYVGIMSPSIGSTHAVQVRLTAATLQGAQKIPAKNRDGYWTNLNFFNSLRELGNTVSLLQSDVPDYLTSVRRRERVQLRWPRNIMELTSRRRNDEIPKAIDELQVSHEDLKSVDICLASNIIEVGIDIDRLGLMTIVGQPKSTAQYIQVSGRVGRRPEVSPGLVFTIYGKSKPRDRSHYEQFRSYHQTLYAQVEPTSVTPFAAPVLDRALHAVLIAYIRQNNPEKSPRDFPQPQFDEALQIMLNRVQIVDPAEEDYVTKVAQTREKEWRAWERTEWDANEFTGNPEQGLMRWAGRETEPNRMHVTWEIPTSMRTVDAECKLEITTHYASEDGESGDFNELR